MKPLKIVLSALFLLCFSGLTAQELTPSYLEGLGDEELLDLFFEVGNDTTKQEKIARIYLDRGRKEGDTVKMARAYDRFARIYKPEKSIAFADSIINLTKGINNVTYPALGYLIKGIKYGELENIEMSYKNYLNAYSVAKQRDNFYQTIFVLDRMAIMQVTWGNKNKALELQKERDSLVNSEGYFEKSLSGIRKGQRDKAMDHYKYAKILSTRCFIICYLLQEHYSNSKVYLDKLEEQLKDYEGAWNYDFNRKWFLDATMEISYYLGDFAKAVAFSDSLIGNDDLELTNSELKNAFLHKGLSLIGVDQKEKGVGYLLKADSIFNVIASNHKDYNVRNDRVLYKNLNKHYYGANLINKRIEYLNRLIFFDSIIKRNYKIFEPKHIREFETPLLLEEKQQLIDSLEQKGKRNTYLQWGGGAVLVVVFGFLGYYYSRQRRFQQRFEALVKTQTEELKPEMPKNTGESLEIDTEIVNQILNGLEKLEKKKGFVDTKLTLNSLAKQLNTNAKYLSSVINVKKGKGFPQYLHDLRLDYAVKDLLSQKVYRKYTIKAIAGECGYRNGESFSRAFYKKYGMYPSYYIKEMEKKYSS